MFETCVGLALIDWMGWEKEKQRVKSKEFRFRKLVDGVLLPGVGRVRRSSVGGGAGGGQ